MLGKATESRPASLRPNSDVRAVPSRRTALDYLGIFTLASFAIAQPILFRLSRHTVFLEDQGINTATQFTLIAVLCLGLPGLLCLLEWIIGRVHERTASLTYRTVLFVLLTATLWPILDAIRILPGSLVVLLGPIGAWLVMWLHDRYQIVRQFVTAAALSIPVFPVMYLFFSPATKLLFPKPSQGHQRTVAAPAPVILIVFDEFYGASLTDRNDELDANRFPNFAAFARTATWYRNATGVHPRTELALPAILTGNYPRGHRPATLTEYPLNLFTLLESTRQYEVVAFEPFSRLCRPPHADLPPPQATSSEQWRSLARVLPPVFVDHLFPIDIPFVLPDVPLAWDAVKQAPPDRPESRTGVFRYHWNSDRLKQFDEFLSRIETNTPPTVYFSHIVVPHTPWCFLPSGRTYALDDGRLSAPVGAHGEHSESWPSDPLAIIHGYQRYLLQVGLADKMLGALMDRLRATELFDPSLMVVLADHGTAFSPNLSRRLPVEQTAAEIASIPLFIKLPGQRSGAIADGNAESIDVLPTIVRALGLSDPPETDGTSLIDPNRVERSAKRLDHDGGTLHLDRRLSNRRRLHNRLLEELGDGSVPKQFYRIGPNPDLVDQALTDLNIIRRSAISIELKEPSRAAQDGPPAFVPSYFVGRITSAREHSDPIDFAIAVNGVVRAVTRTYSEPAVSDYWSAMVPESAYKTGANNVEIFVVQTANGRVVALEPVLDAPLRPIVSE